MAQAPNYDDWVKALNEVENGAIDVADPHVLTMAEFRVALGNVHRTTATVKMQKLIAAGKVVQTRKNIRRSDGCCCTVPAYRFVSKAIPAPAKPRRAKR